MQTREKIVKAAMDCMASKGYEKTTVTEIVKRAGVAQGTFYIYFKHKRDILKDIMLKVRKEVEENLEAQISPEDSPAEKIHKALKSGFLVHQKYKNLAVPLQSGAVALEIQKYYNQIGKKFTSWLEERIDEGNREGIFSVKKPGMAARFIIALFERISHSTAISDDPDSFDNIFPEMVNFINQGLNYHEGDEINE